MSKPKKPKPSTGRQGPEFDNPGCYMVLLIIVIVIAATVPMAYDTVSTTLRGDRCADTDLL